ncbi:LacI family DNA-binding transcriptional regulator [Histidinibacterium lentulum]|uniref:LacI family transcriptional regulator n=1 Tax=Histidinibacterium lentulum TaxID=2480588 RepID=A0A3N2R8P7_9RHOB|nr:LacI family DNA-binding transcriptional regulator [Histidinibacterium lentulum]ROU03706.1 LacI family transcriptional regulator [Histidinibacterium lentulum]
MPHRFPVKEIALQAGVGTATVDRVLNGRGGVRAGTVARVEKAIAELEAQAGQLSIAGRRLIVDLLVEAPQTFIDELGSALRRELPLMQPAAFRVRADMRTRFPVPQLSAALARVERTGSHGVILMAPDAPPLSERIRALEGAGIPVITLASDMPGSGRSGYVGLDNGRAGETAAWIIARTRPDTARVLVTIRNPGFRGEGERAAGFRVALARHLPAAEVLDLTEGTDGPAFLDRLTRAALSGPPPDALYSIGGSNRRLLAALSAAGVTPALVIGHDLDPDNRALLAEGALDAVLYHDLAEDIRTACRIILARASRGAMHAPPGGAALRLMLPPMLG